MLNSVIESCASTNDLARILGEEGAPHGSWISARIQEKGRGRLGRVWESKPGNLFLSLVSRIENQERWTWIPLATAVGAARALLERNFQIQIKWPNDLWLDRKKLGGILCEAVGNSKGSFVVIGIGLNCLFAPEGLDQQTACLSQVSPEPVSADDIRNEVIQGVLRALDSLNRDGVSSLSAFYWEHAAFPPGSIISWGEDRKGKVLGLGERGELRVQADQGEEILLFAEDIQASRLRPIG